MKRSLEIKVKFENLEKFATKTLMGAGKILLDYFQKIKRKDISFKAKQEIVLPADLASERFIIRQLKAEFPDFNILSEEVGFIDRKSDWTWFCDPLDGTTNFAMSNPLFAISLALAYKQETIFGAAFAPFLKELYLAGKNKGSFLYDKKALTSNVSRLKEALLLFCYGRSKPDFDFATRLFRFFRPSVRQIRQLGSACLELVFVGMGRADCALIKDLKPWDVAFGELFVREAHGLTSDFAGQPWQLKSPDVIATNKYLYKKIIKKLSFIL